MNDDTLKICSKCREAKTLSEFDSDPRVRCKHRADCKACEKDRRFNRRAETAEYMRKHYLEKRETEWPGWVLEKREFLKKLNDGEVTISEGQKVCTTCWQIKMVSMFHKNKIRKDGVSNRCRSCSHNIGMKYNSTHKDQIREQNRRWAKENPIKARERSRRSGEQYRNTIRGRLNNISASRINDTLKRGVKGYRRWEDLVGYTVDELKNHLEKQFTPEMNWKNHGTYWHIDHKIPIAAFNYERPEDLDFKRCWFLKNLQPLEVRKNKSKGAKIDRPFQPSLCIEVCG